MLIPLLVTSLVLFVAYIIHTFRYWKNKNIPYVIVTHFTHSPEKFGKHYTYFKSKGEKYFGIRACLLSTLMVIDLDLIKHILAKDFQYFNTRGIYYNEKEDPLTAHLFNIGGQKWRKLRVKLTPTFTSGKMKMMFQTLLECSKPLLEFVDISAQNGNCVDIKEALACYTTDVIGSCAFGLDCNSFEENNVFRKMAKKIFNPSLKRFLRRNFTLAFPKFSRILGIKVFEQDIADFYMNVVKKTIEYREKNNYTRKDFMQLLIDMKNNKSIDEDIKKEMNNEGITFEEIAAQAFIFFLAGFETSSTTMNFCLYELALNPDIQEKIRNEINEVLSRHEGKITYDSVMEMKYLAQTIDETLRKYPPVPTLTRKCTSSYKIPDTDTVIDEGTIVIIPAYHIHHDPEFYPDPEEFKPERFSDENKIKRNPYSYLPFGEGPKNCIGLRFGLLQSKIGLVTLLQNYRFSLNPRTITPLEISPRSFILTFTEQVLMDVHKI